jgi:hypothetical protein
MSERDRISRRSFLRTGGQFAAGALAAGVLSPRKAAGATPRPAGRAAGPNDRINLAVIGVRGRGLNHIDGFGALPNVKIAALCDVDLNVLEERAAYVEKTFGARPTTFPSTTLLLP